MRPPAVSMTLSITPPLSVLSPVSLCPEISLNSSAISVHIPALVISRVGFSGMITGSICTGFFGAKIVFKKSDIIPPFCN